MSLEVYGLVVPYGPSARFEGDAYETRFRRGAFRKSIRGGSVSLRINHGKAPVTRQGGGRLIFDDDMWDDGLHFSAVVDAPGWMELIETNAAAGNLNGVSVGIGFVRGARMLDGLFVVDDADLVEVSLTIGLVPRYSATWARVRPIHLD